MLICSTCQGFSLSCKIVCQRVRTSYCFMSDMGLMSRMVFLTWSCCIRSFIWKYAQCDRGIILLTISIILKVLVLWHVAQCHRFTNHWQLNFVWWCLIFVNCQYWTGFVSLFWHPRILRSHIDFCKICSSPYYTEW